MTLFAYYFVLVYFRINNLFQI